MKAWSGVLMAVLICAAGYAGWREFGQKKPAPPPPPPVPVSAVKAKAVDLPVYLLGIGTVRALNSVEIHPQVGGVLLSVPVREGDEVKKGAVLAVIDPKPFQAALDKAKAQRQQDQAQLDNAQADAKRYTSLAKSDFASRQQVDTQLSTVNRFQGMVAADDAAIEEAEINLGYCVVHAPLDGRVGLRRVDPGNLIQANAAGPGILSVVQDRPIAVVFTLPEKVLPTVHQAMARGPVPVLVDTSDHATQLAAGILLTTDNAVDTASGSIGLKATFANAEGALTPGQFVSVRLQSGTARGIGVPREAIEHGQDGLFVLLVKPDKTAERRVVEVAYDDGKTAVISKGVSADELVVTSGQSRVSAGTHLALHDDGKPDPQAGADADTQQSARK